MYFYMIRLSIISSPSGQINQKSCPLSHQVLKILFLKFSLVLIDSQRMEQFIYIQRLITEIGSHLYIDATEKLFFHTIYSVSKLIDVLYFVLIYTQKGLFQWPSYRGEGILATVVKIVHIQKALRYRQNL